MKSKFLTSSLESEGSASDSKEPDLFGQLPSVNETPSAKPSSKSTGLKSPSTTMSEPSQQMDLEELTSSAADSHANRGVSPGSSEAQKMTETSGQKWLGLLKTYGLDGSLAKMCVDLLTSQWASSAAYLTWKASATKPSHLLFQLAPSMPRTDETESGLWATPLSSSRGGRSKASIERGGGVTLQQQVKLWPTPTTQDNIQVRGQGKATGKHGTTLGGAVRMWPTPKAIDYKGSGTSLKAIQREADKSNLWGTVMKAELPNHVGGSPNPPFVEWLMGYPVGWTDLKVSEMPSSRKSSKKLEEQSLQVNNEPNKN
jgi:hypothetical protein